MINALPKKVVDHITHILALRVTIKCINAVKSKFTGEVVASILEPRSTVLFLEHGKSIPKTGGLIKSLGKKNPGILWGSPNKGISKFAGGIVCIVHSIPC